MKIKIILTFDDFLSASVQNAGPIEDAAPHFKVVSTVSSEVEHAVGAEVKLAAIRSYFCPWYKFEPEIKGCFKVVRSFDLALFGAAGPIKID